MGRARVLGVVSAMIAVLVWFLYQSRDLGVKQDTRQVAEVARLRAELAELKNTVRRSEGLAIGAIQAASMMQSATPEPQKKNIQSPLAPPRESPMYSQLDTADYRDRLEGHFREERPDPNWSKQALRLVESHLRRGLPKDSELVSVDCRQCLCRIESRHRNDETYQQFVSNAFLFRDGEWPGTVLTLPTRDTKTEVVTAVGYLVRPGEDIERIIGSESANPVPN